MNLNGLRLFGGVLYLSLTLLTLAKASVGDNGINKTTTDFATYRITHPTLYHGRTRREISTSRNTDGGHHSTVTLIVPVDGEELVLDLELNEDLVPADHTLQYQEEGKIIHYKSKKEELDLCHYHGSLRGKSNSWAAVSTCHGISGVIFDGSRTRYIEPAEGSEIQAQHFLYDHDDQQSSRHCGNKGHVNKKVTNKYSRYMYNDFTQYLDGYNTNNYPRYVELVLVADYAMYIESGRNVRAVQSFMISSVNVMNTLYASLNIKLALVRAIVWSEGDEIPVEQDSDITLQNFVYYKQSRLSGVPHDHAQLLTARTFSNQVLGVAYIGAICRSNSASVASHFYKTVQERVAITLAHELGHSLGMQHDDDYYCQCPDRTCIMFSSDNGTGNNKWSSCSRYLIAQLFRSGEDQCLLNKPRRMMN